ncbi:sugar phosphate isomerase/epimerase [Actinoallomurus spadix]|uniref:Xylose isomerase-like TIM barrel domain-containing protein n=1 Tax=Actinoallomurus spadix TaxID=79912 RepID=A0ABN0XJ84_9ACTN|nr:TIM barrel protein [Actinoallomurus spadix]MCO5984925.1 sugar phosphate isomerase/epimerase [Actinoallomurus spadix]
MTDTAAGLPRLGITLFSLTLEQRRPGTDLIGLIREVGARGLGPGLEMVAFQSLRGWPRLDETLAQAVRGALDDAGLTPSCLAINLDLALRPGRLLSDDEAHDYLAVQLRGAAALGFPVVRVGAECGPAVLTRLLPLAEELRVRIGVEIHSPLTLDAPPVAALKELFTRLDTEWLGFIPDFSASMRAIPGAVTDAHRAAGIPPELTGLATRIWAEPGPTMAKFGDLERRAAALGARPDQIGNLTMLLTMHGRMRPDRWADFFPHVVHVHGKFYGVTDGQDPSIDYPAVLAVLREQKYTGFISSEYEAHAYTDRHDAFDQVAAHQRMCKTLLEAR